MTPRAKKLASPDLFWPVMVRIHRHSSALCVLFVACGIVLWLMWADSPLRHRKFIPPIPAVRMTWLADGPANDGGAWRSDVRAIASPILFALPTPLGFSRDALRPSGLKPPPPSVATGFTPIYATPATTIVARLAAPPLGETVAGFRSLPVPEDRTQIGGVRGATGSVLVVVAKLGRETAVTRAIPVEANSIFADAQSWEAVARVDLDNSGWADRVLLEKPGTVTNRNASLVQLLRTMNFGTNGARSCRVAVHYEAAVARTVGRAKEAKP